MSAAMHSQACSPPQQLSVSPSTLRAAPFPTEDAMCALLTTVGNLTATVASNQAYAARQIALLTQLMQQQQPVSVAGGPRCPDIRGGPPRFDARKDNHPSATAFCAELMDDTWAVPLPRATCRDLRMGSPVTQHFSSAQSL